MLHKYFTETVGTFILVFCGTGAMIVDEVHPNSIGHVGVAATWGLVVAALIYALGKTSGCHINPAVSIVLAINKKIEWAYVPYYLIAQAVGAFAASVLLHFLFPASLFLGATLPAGTALQSFVLEIILSFFLLIVVLSASNGDETHKILAPFTIGSVVLLEAMFAGPVCGASMNPIRSLAPAIVSSHTEHLWVYISAPFIGAFIALFIHHYINKK